MRVREGEGGRERGGGEGWKNNEESERERGARGESEKRKITEGGRTVCIHPYIYLKSTCMYTYIYIYVYTCTYISIYVCIYI